MALVYDVFTYNGERDMLEIHINALDKYVDRFIIVEAKTTFSGNKKPLYFFQHQETVKPFWNKIDYHVINERYSEEEIQLAEHSPNTVGARHWKNEFLQKESIHKALKAYGVQDEDVVYIGDVDEIWKPYYPFHPTKLKLLVYAYKLDNLSNEEFWGTLVSKYKDIKDECLNHMRSTQAKRTDKIYGWHFTSMGGLPEVRRKLNDSYTPESYNTYAVQQQLPDRLRNNEDYLGRNFTFKHNISQWPSYLKEHKDQYKHLCSTSLTSASK